jgi:hypothetical protein
MKTMRWLVLLCLLAVAVIALPAAAQDSNPYGMSDSDWALFEAAQNPGEGQLAYAYTSTLAISADGSEIGWDVTGSGLVGPNGFSMDNTGTVSMGAGSTSPAPLNMRVVGDSLFLGVEGMGWYGGTLDELLQIFGSLAGGMAPGLDGAAEGAASGDLSGLMAQPGAMEAMMAIGTMDPTTFVTISRLEDNEGLAHFQTYVDIGALLQDQSVQQALGSATSANGAEMSAADMEMLVSGLAGSYLQIDQYVDAEMQAVNNTDITIQINLPPTTAGGKPGSISLTLGVSLSDAAGQSVEAPAEYTSFAEAISGIMGGMMGQMGG